MSATAVCMSVWALLRMFTIRSPKSLSLPATSCAAATTAPCNPVLPGSSDREAKESFRAEIFAAIVDWEFGGPLNCWIWFRYVVCVFRALTLLCWVQNSFSRLRSTLRVIGSVVTPTVVPSIISASCGKIFLV